MNIPLKKYGGLPTFKNVPEVIFPILWVNEVCVWMCVCVCGLREGGKEVWTERRKEGRREGKGRLLVCVCVCVCVLERERKNKKRERNI